MTDITQLLFLGQPFKPLKRQMMRADVPADKGHSSMGATTSQTPGGVCAATASVFAEMIGQSIANIGPTLTCAIKISVVVGLAGIAAWLSYLIPTAGLIFVALILAYSRDAIRSPDRRRRAI